ncbi:hypothetical protein EZ449_05090 [Pedobacter frigidisoli]|uniref:Uncharacterized protein n=1 Tax=Pedobacter frigidisoli TaxID=2530455 RepID=A0A4R0PA07_9SPHI|nr:hypothetical protein [Pedobacter frigidisoli]TCD11637.1 hypothetical protein EZ449_05090 [Pedobacter frigidisoli]
MEIEFIKANTSRTKPKATIHMTGKLGFNIEASTLMEIENKKSLIIGKDRNDADRFYLFESEEEGAGRVAKAGEYYYLNLGNAFDLLEMDYKKYTIMFDVSKSTYQDKDIYVLKKRTPKERKI